MKRAVCDSYRSDSRGAILASQIDVANISCSLLLEAIEPDKPSCLSDDRAPARRVNQPEQCLSVPVVTFLKQQIADLILARRPFKVFFMWEGPFLCPPLILVVSTTLGT